MIRNLIFDMGGVLVGFNRDCCIAAFENLGAADVADYVRDFRTEDLFQQIELGTMTTEGFCDEVRSIAHCQADNHEIVAAWNALLTPCTDQKRQRLAQLRKKYRLFLLSNTNEMHWIYCRDKLIGTPDMPTETIFEQCFLSYEMHCAKPSSEIFERLMQQTGIKAEESLFVDDSELNTEAAARLGLHVFHEHPDHSWVDLLE